MNNKLLNFVNVTKDNIEVAIRVQNIIFPYENGTQNFIDSINKHGYRKELNFWIVYNSETPVGVIGLYSYHEYPSEAWMGWFGVLPKYRKRGFGGTIFDFFESYARTEGYKNIRLYTDEIDNQEGIKLYYKKGMVSEKYNNKDDIIPSIEKTLIFSKSLTQEPVQNWNNKYLGLTKQVERQNAK